MDEMLVYHKATPYIAMKLSDSRVRLTFAKAKSEGWPFILHLEFALMSVDMAASYMPQLEAFLRGNLGHPFVMIHMGRMVPKEARRLLGAHPNLSFMMSSATKAIKYVREHPRFSNGYQSRRHR